MENIQTHNTNLKKPTLRYHFLPIRLPTIKVQESVWGSGETNTLHTAGGNANWNNLLKGNLAKSTYTLIFWSSNSTFRILPWKWNYQQYKNTHAYGCSLPLVTEKYLEQYLNAQHRMAGLYIHIVEYPEAKERKVRTVSPNWCGVTAWSKMQECRQYAALHAWKKEVKGKTRYLLICVEEIQQLKRLVTYKVSGKTVGKKQEWGGAAGMRGCHWVNLLVQLQLL